MCFNNLHHHVKPLKNKYEQKNVIFPKTADTIRELSLILNALDSKDRNPNPFPQWDMTQRAYPHYPNADAMAVTMISVKNDFLCVFTKPF